MSDKLKILGVIPARGGSKGIPNKNIVNLCGKPLIAYTIETALSCRMLDKCVVSTDSPAIAEVAERFGISVPRLRPAELAGDSAKSVDVVLDVLKHEKPEYDIVVLLQPTTPLRSSVDVEGCLELLREDVKLDAAATVCPLLDPHPHKVKKLEGGLLLPFVEGTSSETPRQRLPPAYRLNGAVYAARVSAVRSSNSMLGTKCGACVMPEERSVNIDSPIDLVVAEHFLRRK